MRHASRLQKQRPGCRAQNQHNRETRNLRKQRQLDHARTTQLRKESHHFTQPRQRRQQRMRRLALLINPIQHEDELAHGLPRRHAQTLRQEHRQHADMLAAPLAEFFPFALLTQRFEGRPQDLGQEVAAGDALGAAHNGVRHFKGGEDGAHNGRLARCGDTVDDHCRWTRCFWLD